MIVIVGNKTDLTDSRKIKETEGQAFAKENKFLFFEVSAKENTNIKSLFFHSIVEIPYFNSFKSKDDTDNKNLKEEFEYENSDIYNAIPGATNDPSRINISLIANNVSEDKKKCKC